VNRRQAQSEIAAAYEAAGYTHLIVRADRQLGIASVMVTAAAPWLGKYRAVLLYDGSAFTWQRLVAKTGRHAHRHPAPTHRREPEPRNPPLKLIEMTVAELHVRKAKLERDLADALSKPGCTECIKNHYRRRIRLVDKMIARKSTMEDPAMPNVIAVKYGIRHNPDNLSGASLDVQAFSDLSNGSEARTVKNNDLVLVFDPVDTAAVYQVKDGGRAWVKRSHNVGDIVTFTASDLPLVQWGTVLTALPDNKWAMAVGVSFLLTMLPGAH